MIDAADGNTIYYYHFDGLGSVVALSDVNSVVVESYSYDVFSEVTIHDANGSGREVAWIYWNFWLCSQHS